jgi:hypothetical protein
MFLPLITDFIGSAPVPRPTEQRGVGGQTTFLPVKPRFKGIQPL